jgi:uncharacterized OsmC-like protein
MDRLNNVDVDGIERFADGIRRDPSGARRTQVIEGEWLLEEGGAQFRSTVRYEGGETVFLSDNPTFMGGGGSLPGPMHYCFYGLASCYTGIFASAASLLGIRLSRLSARVEADVDFSRVFGTGDDPIMEEVRVKLAVESDAPEEKIREAEEMALRRCPVVYTLRNPVRLMPSLEIRRVGGKGEAA